jgi:hypothetical protein
VLKKEYSNYESHHGVIVGFDNFNALPTILVCYLNASYSGVELKLLSINAETKDVEICSDVNDIPIEIDKVEIVKKFDNEIKKKELEIEDLERKKDYFLTKFGQFFQTEKES